VVDLQSSRATRIEHLDGIKTSFLRNAIGHAADGASDVRAMSSAISVVPVAGKVVQPSCAALELLMGVSLPVKCDTANRVRW
jgi:hypothetical protein